MEVILILARRERSLSAPDLDTISQRIQATFRAMLPRDYGGIGTMPSPPLTL